MCQVHVAFEFELESIGNDAVWYFLTSVGLLRHKFRWSSLDFWWSSSTDWQNNMWKNSEFGEHFEGFGLCEASGFFDGVIICPLYGDHFGVKWLGQF